MAALKRGIPGYAVGNANVTPPDTQPPAVPPPVPTPALPVPAPVPDQAASGIRPGSLLDRVFGGAQAAAPSSGLDQLMRGQFTQAAQNPQASPLTADIAGGVGGFLDHFSRHIRVNNVSQAPTGAEKVANYLFGTQAERQAIQDRDVAAKAFSNPLVRQELMTNPQSLHAAETEPKAFAQVVQHPDFIQAMQARQGALAEAQVNPKVHRNDQSAVVNTMLTHNINSNQANAVVAPHRLTREEFIDAVTGMRMNNFIRLFGNQIGHVMRPQDLAASSVFNALNNNVAQSQQRLANMMAEDEAARKAITTPPNSRASLFGTSNIDKQKAEILKHRQNLLDAAKSYSGITGKIIAAPEQETPEE